MIEVFHLTAAVAIKTQAFFQNRYEASVTMYDKLFRLPEEVAKIHFY